MVILNQRRMFFDAFGGVLVASRMYVSTSALLSCYKRVFITKKIAYFMISEFWTFGLQNLFVRTPESFFSNLRTFGLKNLRTLEPSNLRTFGLIGCNRLNLLTHNVLLLGSVSGLVYYLYWDVAMFLFHLYRQLAMTHLIKHRIGSLVQF